LIAGELSATAFSSLLPQLAKKNEADMIDNM
jgi:hypothetical protein